MGKIFRDMTAEEQAYYDAQFFHQELSHLFVGQSAILKVKFVKPLLSVISIGM